MGTENVKETENSISDAKQSSSVEPEFTEPENFGQESLEDSDTNDVEMKGKNLPLHETFGPWTLSTSTKVTIAGFIAVFLTVASFVAIILTVKESTWSLDQQ